MGLDITAYSRLEYLGQHAADGWCVEEHYDEDWNRTHIATYAYDSFPQSFRGIPVVGKRAVRDATFLIGGCYEVTRATATHGFRAGSYTGYGRWREDLQQRFNPERDPDKPFYELIWFADNEGCIGPEASRDLLADFLLHFERYPADEGYLALYKHWLQAFKLAADGGLVEFH